MHPIGVVVELADFLSQRPDVSDGGVGDLAGQRLKRSMASDAWLPTSSCAVVRHHLQVGLDCWARAFFDSSSALLFAMLRLALCPMPTARK